eukprot:m.54229 g.54229  ORF g.54229 m.54229 type:complete len:1438 (+) comp7513_c0_seq2:69-4382(+)
MGIPKFYRYTSERYPCLSQTIKDAEVPEIDNLYLDMNGIIHNCSHPNDEDPNFRITEDIIFDGVMRYIEGLFRIIRPKRLFYMAVDGCAPRAKMNQQRARRFRSAKDAEAALEAAIKKGTVIAGDIDPETGKKREDRFDSNCITPGTPFMARLQEHLEYFVHRKLTSDPTWKGVHVIMDGHECPGEGEHKILDYIRSLKSTPGFNPNTRHCMYGLDADLMILGLLSHEPYFFLLREEVTFGKSRGAPKKELDGVEQKTWHLLSLTLFRDYLDAEFSSLKDELKFQYDFERLLDDWVLLSFFVGNDFLPHLPDFHIADDITPFIYNCYRTVMKKCDGWLTDGGIIDLPRLQMLIDEMAKFDVQRFDEFYVDTRWAGYDASGNGKKAKGKGKKGGGKPASQDNTSTNPGAMLLSMLHGAMGAAAEGAGGDMADNDNNEQDDEEVEDGESIFDLEMQQHKRAYYLEKFELADVEDGFVDDLAKRYVTGLQWVLLYYFKGVPAWGWFFDSHYAPYVSDIRGVGSLKIEFDLGEPFLPFEQLMAVLPPASKKHVPPAMQPLMTDPDSPIADFYPLDFKTDLNGKKQDWEALVLICFIDEKRLLSAMAERQHLLTDEERSRNIRSTPVEHWYDNSHPTTYKSPSRKLPDLEGACVNKKVLPWPHAKPDRKHVLLNDDVDMECYMVGYPTLRHIPFSAELKEARVTVFNRPSDKETLVLTLTSRETPNCAALGRAVAAGGLVGKTVWVDWPHLREGMVVAVSDSGHRYSDKGPVKYSSQLSAAWKTHASDVKHSMMFKRGIDIGPVTVMVHVRKLLATRVGYTRAGKAQVEKMWSPEEVAVPWQLVVDGIRAIQSDATAAANIEDKFVAGTTVVKIAKKFRGCVGKVVGVDVAVSQLHLQLDNHAAPSFKLSSGGKGSSDFVPFHQATKATGLSGSVMGRIISSVYVYDGTRHNPGQRKRDLGLKLKFAKREEEKIGFARNVGEKRWELSHTTVAILKEFKARFPAFIHGLANAGGNGDVYIGDIAPGDAGAAMIRDIQAWQKTLPCHDAELVPCGTTYLEAADLARLAVAQNAIVASGDQAEVVDLQKVHVNEVHVLDGTKPPPIEAPLALGDRVVYVNGTTSIPFGSRGNVVSMIGRSRTDVEVLFDRPVPGGTDLNGRGPAGRGVRSNAAWFVKITHPLRAPGGGSGGATAPPFPTPVTPSPDAANLMALLQGKGSGATVPPPPAAAVTAVPPFLSTMGAATAPAPMPGQPTAPTDAEVPSEAAKLMALLSKSVQVQQQQQPPAPASLPVPSAMAAQSNGGMHSGVSAPPAAIPLPGSIANGNGAGLPSAPAPIKAHDLGTHAVSRQPKGPGKKNVGGFVERRTAAPPPPPKEGEPDLDEYATMWKYLSETNVAVFKEKRAQKQGGRGTGRGGGRGRGRGFSAKRTKGRGGGGGSGADGQS